MIMMFPLLLDLRILIRSVEYELMGNEKEGG